MTGKTDPAQRAGAASFLICCVVGLVIGCSSERRVEKDPEAIKAALEKHRATAAREAAESGAS